MNTRLRLKALLGLLVLLVCLNAKLTMAAPFGELIRFWDDREEGSSFVVDHSRWQGILDKYLDDEHVSGINLFDYGSVTDDDEKILIEYLQYLQSFEPRQFNSNEQKAYWINLYNALTVAVILDRGSDIESIRDIRSGVFTRGPWQLDLAKIVTQDLSLDDIEHGILRPIWKDNRIHYAVNCASISCPNLLKTAFTGANIEELLNKAARDYVNHERGVKIENGKLTLSSIYDWYSEDFGSGVPDLIIHLRQYAEPQLASQLQVFTQADFDYNWDLNAP